MAFVIKTLLPTSALQLYKNTEDTTGVELKAVNIVLCNNSAGAVEVSLSFYSPNLSETFATGAVLFEYSLPANTTITVQDRYIYQDDIISAYASVVDVISLSIDILGAVGRYTTPLP